MQNAHKPLIATLIETEWSYRFESFTPEELRTLTMFNDLVWDTTNWPFFQQPALFHVQMSPDRYEQRLEHAGTAELRRSCCFRG